MDYVDGRAFELELRAMCDRAYERPSPPNNPMMKLMEDRLSRDEAKEVWGGKYLDIILILNQFTLPRLMERCPHIDARVGLWGQVYPEYGINDTVAEAHLTLYRNFLLGLGVRPEDCELVLDLEKPYVKKTVAAIEAMSFLELVSSFLARETIGPKVFGLVAKKLASNFDLSAEQLRYFSVHNELDKEDSAALFPLVTRYADNADRQQLVRDTISKWFDQERPSQYACKLGTLDWFYTEQQTK